MMIDKNAGQLIAQRIVKRSEKPEISAVRLRTYYLLQLRKIDAVGDHILEYSGEEFTLEEGDTAFLLTACANISGYFEQHVPSAPLLKEEDFPELQDYVIDVIREMFVHMEEQTFRSYIEGMVDANAAFIQLQSSGEYL